MTLDLEKRVVINILPGVFNLWKVASFVQNSRLLNILL